MWPTDRRQLSVPAALASLGPRAPTPDLPVAVGGVCGGAPSRFDHLDRRHDQPRVCCSVGLKYSRERARRSGQHDGHGGARTAVPGGGRSITTELMDPTSIPAESGRTTAVGAGLVMGDASARPRCCVESAHKNRPTSHNVSRETSGEHSRRRMSSGTESLSPLEYLEVREAADAFHSPARCARSPTDHLRPPQLTSGTQWDATQFRTGRKRRGALKVVMFHVKHPTGSPLVTSRRQVALQWSRSDSQDSIEKRCFT